MNRIRDFWLPELKAMGVKWVKIFNHDGALDFAELLLAEGIMPLVRIYHPTPNPSRLSVKEVVQIDAFLRSGVRYFEFNSEPDQDSEWRGGRVPANGIDLVVENTIANLETILERGGMPGIPAVSNGSRWDLVGKIIAHGRKDLFAGPVWQALHNFPRNRPLDYPYDIGNQEGAAYTYRFYQVVLNEEWGENAWRGRTLEDINRLRRDRCAPGATIADDPACWLAYEFFDARNRSHLGRSLPLLATEGGYLIGEDIDPRYPATTPDLHMAQTLEACRIMMGVTQRFKPAADYYFCTAFWLLANAQLGSSSPWWENHAWYSERWPGGSLPIVTALKAEPKVARRLGAQEQGELVTILGAVAHAGDHRVVVLERNGVERMRVELDAQSRYQMPGLLPGSYLLRLLDTDVAQPVELTPGRREVVVNLDGAPAQAGLSRSQISGAVRGGSGAVVSLVRAGDGQEWVTMARSDGLYRFIDLPAGTYSVRVNPEGSRVDQVVLDGANQRTVNLAVAGWGYTIRPLDGHNLGTLYCSVEGQKNVMVQAHSGDWSSPPVRTGSAPEISPYGCQISPLEAGHYIVAVEGLTDETGKKVELEARVHVDKKRPVLVEFVHSRVTAEPEPAQSKITGRVIGGLPSGEKLLIRLIDGNAEVRDQALAEDATFVFANLPAGLYSLIAVDHTEIDGMAAITLDGQNHVSVELMAPIQPSKLSPGGQAQSILAANVPHAAGQSAQLLDALGNEWVRVVSHDDRLLFESLPAGLYSLSIAPGYYQPDLRLDGANGLEVIFAELLPTWEAEVANAGSMPGYSVVRVDVEEKIDLPVHIWKEDWEGMMRRTGSKPDLGPHALEFSPLGPGHYMIEPEGLGIWTDLTLTGLEVMWVNFRHRPTPAAPNMVRAYQSKPAPNEAAPPLPAGPPPYLYIAAPPETTAEVVALLRFVADHGPSFGDSLEDALKAERVVIVGADSGAGQQAAALLAAASVAVESFHWDGAGTLERSLVALPASNGSHGEQSALASR
jgi:hypothetical protein